MANEAAAANTMPASAPSTSAAPPPPAPSPTPSTSVSAQPEEPPAPESSAEQEQSKLQCDKSTQGFLFHSIYCEHHKKIAAVLYFKRHFYLLFLLRQRNRRSYAFILHILNGLSACFCSVEDKDLTTKTSCKSNLLNLHGFIQFTEHNLLFVLLPFSHTHDDCRRKGPLNC